MKDKLDDQLRKYFTTRKKEIRIPGFPLEIIPAYKTHWQLGFSLGFFIILTVSFIFFHGYVFLARGEDIPLSRICNNVIEEYELDEKILEGFYYLQDSFQSEKQDNKNSENINILHDFPYIKMKVNNCLEHLYYTINTQIFV